MKLKKIWMKNVDYDFVSIDWRKVYDWNVK